MCGVAAAVGGRAWALAAWWLREGDAARWIWDPLSPAGYASAGALAGAGAVVAVHRAAFGAEETARVLDVIAPAGFVGLAMARLGCLFEGCDVGRASDVAWSLTYPRGHAVWSAHVEEGLVSAASQWSAAVHPFALYIAVPTLVVAVASLGLRGRVPGWRTFVVAMSYGGFRLLAELFRDSEGGAPLHEGFFVAIGVIVVTVAWWTFDRRAACRESTNG